MKVESGYKKKLLHRLKIVRGHMDKVIKMIEADTYCIDTLQQTSAIVSSLRQVEQIILENHLRMCVTDAVTNKKNIEEKVEEVIKVFKARK